MNDFLLHCDSWLYIYCDARVKCFFCFVNHGRASWISLKKLPLAVLKLKGAICIYRTNQNSKLMQQLSSIQLDLKWLVFWDIIVGSIFAISNKIVETYMEYVQRTNWFPCEMLSVEGVEKFHTDGLSLPSQIWFGKCVNLIHGSLKQICLMVWPIFYKSYYTRYTDLGSDMLSVSNFSTHSTDIFFRKPNDGVMKFHLFSLG